MTIRKPTTEHSPLSGWDEYPIHQVGQPLRVVATSDERAFERYYFSCQDKSGEFVMIIGIGFYPNLGTADAYAAISYGTSHTTVRAHRIMDEDRSRIEVGPIRAEMVEPFREWALTVGPNDQELEVDIRWHDTKRAVFHRYDQNCDAGRLSPEMCGYETFGTVEGTVSVKGKKFDLSPQQVIGSRDHHWGVRDGVGGLSRVERPRVSHIGQFVEFEEFGIWDNRILYNIGSDTPRASKIIHQDRQLEFDPATNQLTGAVIDNVLPNGEVKRVTYRHLNDRTIHLRTGMYLGADNNGEPEHDYLQGMHLGDDVVVGGATYDVSDPQVRQRIGGYDDHLMEATCDGETSVGIVEAKNPIPWEFCQEGVPGFTFLKR